MAFDHTDLIKTVIHIKDTNYIIIGSFLVLSKYGIILMECLLIHYKDTNEV
jgi:hypothetical protein